MVAFCHHVTTWTGWMINIVGGVWASYITINFIVCKNDAKVKPIRVGSGIVSKTKMANKRKLSESQEFVYT